MRQLSILFLLIFFFSSCAPTPKMVDVKRPERGAKETEGLNREEYETKSLELFNEILSLSMSSGDREAVLPRMEELYKRIITEYPEAPLAQESYWRLITLYVDDYSPPAYVKAEPLYYEFSKRYPDSIFKTLIEETLSRSYYKNREWDRLLRVSSPAYNKYVNDGKRPRPLLIFMYSEANFNLGNLKEAKRGYKAAIELYPELGNNVRIKERLDELKGVN